MSLASLPAKLHVDHEMEAVLHAQVWNAQDSEDEVLAMVVRVKLDTIMGSMVRELIAPVAAVKEKEPFEAVKALCNGPPMHPFQHCRSASSYCSFPVLQITMPICSQFTVQICLSVLQFVVILEH